MSDQIIASILEIINNHPSPPSNRDTLLESYWHSHPRFKYFKSLPKNAKLLDIGAASGGLVNWKFWGEPIRNDLKMYAIDLSKGEFFDSYEDFQIGNLEDMTFKWPDSHFDAIILAHVLEHIKNHKELLTKILKLLKPQGTLYIEIPTKKSLEYPSRKEFLSRGFEISTTNFFDDNTHFQTFEISELQAMLPPQETSTESSGTIHLPEIEKDILKYGYEHKDSELTTYGAWSILKWAEYLILRKNS